MKNTQSTIKQQWQARVNIWLSDNPEVGQLNDGNGGYKYYINNSVGETLEVAPLTIIGGVS